MASRGRSGLGPHFRKRLSHSMTANGGRILFWSQEHGLCASITLHNGRRLLLHKRLEFAQKTMANRKALIRFSSFSRGGRAVKAV